MLDKFKDKFKSTPNVGNKGVQIGNNVPPGSTAYITFPDIDPQKEYEISGMVTIGREVGEIILDDAQLSPRHCSLNLADEVITLIDHGSDQGTFLNDKRLDTGKKYILNEDDQLRLGDLYVSISWKESEFKEPKESTSIGIETKIIRSDILPEVEVKDEKTGVTKLFGQLNDAVEAEKEAIPELPVMLKLKDQNFDVEDTELDPKILTQTKANKFSKSKRKKIVTHSKLEEDVATDLQSAHLIYRLVGIVVDVLICLSFMNIFYVFVDIKNFLSKVTEVIALNIPFASYTDEAAKHIPLNMAQGILEFEHIDLIFQFIVLK